MKYMERIFDREQVNTGRQQEFDYLKGLFMVAIFWVHAYQATLSYEDIVLRSAYGFFTLSGAAIFIFVMGMGSVYSRASEPEVLARSGVRMLLNQYLSNLYYVACLALPFSFVKDRMADVQTYRDLVILYFQFVNIFFISGILYLAMALAKKLKLQPVGYAFLGLAFAVIAPFVYGRPVSIPVLGYLIQLVIGEGEHVTFAAIYYLSYAFFGIAFGHLLKHVRDKRAFYRIVFPVSALVAVIWWICTLSKYGFTDKLYDYLCVAYTEPDLFHVFASLAHILLLAGLFFFAGNIMKKSGALGRQILFYNRHVSKYYAIHIGVYFVIYGFNRYEGFSSAGCLLITILCMLITECIVRAWVSWHEK